MINSDTLSNQQSISIALQYRNAVVNAIRKHQSKKVVDQMVFGFQSTESKIENEKVLDHSIHFPFNRESIVTQSQPEYKPFKKTQVKKIYEKLEDWEMNLGSLHTRFKKSDNGRFAIGDCSFQLSIEKIIFHAEDCSLYEVTIVNNGEQIYMPFIMKICILNDDTYRKFNVTKRGNEQYVCTSFEDVICQVIYLSQIQPEHYYGHFHAYDTFLDRHYSAIFMPKFKNNLDHAIRKLVKQIPNTISAPAQNQGQTKVHSWLAQAYLACLYKYQKLAQLCHNDLKLDNIMYNQTKKEYVFVSIGDGSSDNYIVFYGDSEIEFFKEYPQLTQTDCRYYMIPTFGKQLVLIDFGISHFNITSNNKKVAITSETAYVFMKKKFKAYDMNHDLPMLICSLYEKCLLTGSNEINPKIIYHWKELIDVCRKICDFGGDRLSDIEKWSLELYIKLSSEFQDSDIGKTFLDQWCKCYEKQITKTQ